jgi:hypothetical protein
VHPLRLATGKPVIGFAERDTKNDVQPGFFKYFSLRSFCERLTRINLPLWQRDVLVLSAVHEQDTNLAVDNFPAHCSRCVDVDGPSAH